MSAHKYAASRDFAWERDDLRRAMMEIVGDRRTGFRTKNGYVSDDVIRARRARNRDITYRYAENKTTAKLNAERYDHVASFD